MGRTKKVTDPIEAVPPATEPSPAELEKMREEEAKLMARQWFQPRPESAIAAVKKVPKEEMIAAIEAESKELEGMDELLDTYLARKMAKMSAEILNAISDEDLKFASLKDKAFALDKLIDKMRLIKGQSTTNIDASHIMSRLASRINPAAELPAEIVKEITVQVSDGKDQ